VSAPNAARRPPAASGRSRGPVSGVPWSWGSSIRIRGRPSPRALEAQGDPHPAGRLDPDPAGPGDDGVGHRRHRQPPAGQSDLPAMTAVACYAGLRPSAVVMLRARALELPTKGWVGST
jgi:hypothetical protein